MDEALRDLAAENAILRGSLYLTARRLKDYQDAPAFEIDDDGGPMLVVIVSPSLREEAAEALEKAQAMLKDEGRFRGAPSLLGLFSPFHILPERSFHVRESHFVNPLEVGLIARRVARVVEHQEALRAVATE
jgi:hypothetical protein